MSGENYKLRDHVFFILSHGLLCDTVVRGKIINIGTSTTCKGVSRKLYIIEYDDYDTNTKEKKILFEEDIFATEQDAISYLKSLVSDIKIGDKYIWNDSAWVMTMHDVFSIVHLGLDKKGYCVCLYFEGGFSYDKYYYLSITQIHKYIKKVVE